MGDMGTFGFDQGVGTYGASTLMTNLQLHGKNRHNTANSSGGLVHSGGHQVY